MVLVQPEPHAAVHVICAVPPPTLIIITTTGNFIINDQISCISRIREAVDRIILYGTLLINEHISREASPWLIEGDPNRYHNSTS